MLLGTQRAIYWHPTGRNEEGTQEYNAPVALVVHWEDRQDISRNSKGEEFTSSAVVYSEMELHEEGYMLLSEEPVATVGNDPRFVSSEGSATKAHRIVVISRISNWNATAFEYKSSLDTG